jgi:predicted enzyme related to lactoylglutathione lyase
MANPFVQVELETADPQKAKSFYSELFQWQLEDMPNPIVPTGTYTMIKVGKGTGGGIMNQIPNGPYGWIAYAEVDDIRAATKKAKALGGEIMKGFSVPIRRY